MSNKKDIVFPKVGLTYNRALKVKPLPIELQKTGAIATNKGNVAGGSKPVKKPKK